MIKRILDFVFGWQIEKNIYYFLIGFSLGWIFGAVAILVVEKI